MHSFAINTIFLLTVSAAPVDASKLPADVKVFLEIREACDHWRGEYGESDPIRQYEIDKNTCEFCQGTDAALASLRRKYHGNQSVLETLKPFRAKVEDPSPQAMKQACQKALSKPPEGADVTQSPRNEQPIRKARRVEA